MIEPDGISPRPAPPNTSTRGRAPARALRALLPPYSARRSRTLIALPLVLALAAVAVDLTRRTTGTSHPLGAAATTERGCVSTTSTAAGGATASTDPAVMSLSTFIGQQTGIRLAGNAPINLDASQVRTLGDSVPAGASVDACADRITFTGDSASMTVEAVPPANPDMTFRVAGLINPTVVVRQGTEVTVEFVNADSDQAHGWMVTTGQPPFAFRPGSQPAFANADAGVIGDPVRGRQGARVITFTAGASGMYQYICPIPGHAQMGMHADFVVIP